MGEQGDVELVDGRDGDEGTGVSKLNERVVWSKVEKSKGPARA
jgi:hypothetical protein